MEGHRDVRRPQEVAIVGPGQGGATGRKDDVVAVAPEAREPSVRALFFHTAQGLQPRTVAAHLEAVDGSGMAREPGSAMRRADGDDAMKPRGRADVRAPGADRQPPHAVTDQDGCHSRFGLEPAHGDFDGAEIAVDRAERRLEGQGQERNARLPEPLHPRVPEAAVAEEAMDEDDAAAALRIRRNAVGNRGRAERLAPQKDAGRDQRLDPPCRKQLVDRRTVGGPFGIGRAKPVELETEGGHISTGDEKRRRQRPGRLPGPERDRHAAEGGRGDQEDDQLLDAGQHGMTSMVIRTSIGSTKEKGLRHYDGGLFKLIA